MNTTATALAPISEPTIPPTPAAMRLLPSATAWDELCRLSERWQELSRDVEAQAVVVALSYSPTP